MDGGEQSTGRGAEGRKCQPLKGLWTSLKGHDTVSRWSFPKTVRRANKLRLGLSGKRARAATMTTQPDEHPDSKPEPLQEEPMIAELPLRLQDTLREPIRSIVNAAVEGASLGRVLNTPPTGSDPAVDNAKRFLSSIAVERDAEAQYRRAKEYVSRNRETGVAEAFDLYRVQLRDALNRVRFGPEPRLNSGLMRLYRSISSDTLMR